MQAFIDNHPDLTTMIAIVTTAMVMFTIVNVLSRNLEK
jgi:hypothetical protein